MFTLSLCFTLASTLCGIESGIMSFESNSTQNILNVKGIRVLLPILGLDVIEQTNVSLNLTNESIFIDLKSPIRILLSEIILKHLNKAILPLKESASSKDQVQINTQAKNQQKKSKHYIYID